MTDPLAAARALAPLARTEAQRTERERRLSPELVAALIESGLCRLCVPRELGGLEADPAMLVEAIEELAHADGSAGWCAMIAATSGAIGAYLPEPQARAVFGDPRAVAGGVFAPRGRAVVDGDGDGYRVSGRWPFASGVQHCDWLMGGCVIYDGEQPRLLAAGRPETRMMLFQASVAEVIDTWSVSGLRGTGSHDMAVADVQVPHAMSLSLIEDRPLRGGVTMRFPVFGRLALGICAVALGLARAAVQDLLELAAGKPSGPPGRTLAQRSATQSEVGRAEAALGSARAFVFEAIARARASADDGEGVALAERARLRLAATHATRTAATVVDAMYELGGGSSIYESNALQRRFRDVHVATQHMMVAPATFELAGRVLLGLDADVSQL